MQQLVNINKIFKNKIFRIPDYQRGYAWQIRQLKDFWEDINSLEEGKNHYTGVISLEEVKKEIWEQWHEDKWVIENKGYDVFFVVDGQQRMTTCVILIQAILDVAKTLRENTYENNEDFELCDTKLSDIKRDYTVIEKSNGIQRSYIFGYEKDNPSYEFLKTKIFNEHSSSNQGQETIYTQNLENAKKFFVDNLLEIPENERLEKLEVIFRKVTKNLLFNEYVIESDIDVSVAFETMNNRGKKLSDLELLKNRLIYLTTLFSVDQSDKDELRKRINDAWKEIYFQLGRNKENPLNDDDFLKAHWTMYFKYSRKTGDDYIHFLLDDYFSPKRVLKEIDVAIKIKEAQEVRDELLDDVEEDIPLETSQKEKKGLEIGDISLFAESIQKASSAWYDTYNPETNQRLTSDERKWLDRLNRLGMGYFRPLIMSSFLSRNTTADERVLLFKTIERYIFIAFRLTQMRSNYGNSEFYNLSRDLYYGNTTIANIVEALEERIQFSFNDDGSFKINAFYDFISNKFRFGAKTGYYSWGGLRYFLYEYEQYLLESSKNSTAKITWEKFTKEQDMISIEHILPQTPDKSCWSHFVSQYSPEEMNYFTNTLGNLLALSQPKNSSLQNDCYENKRVDGEKNRGYFNGSYSECRVAETYKEWTPYSIKERGLELLGFMEERWNINLGDDTTKMKLLNLEFLD
ncbi:MAG: hypothetical protein HHAS10_04990 [Candidatus Altimarinota bacterium]